MLLASLLNHTSYYVQSHMFQQQADSLEQGHTTTAWTLVTLQHTEWGGGGWRWALCMNCSSEEFRETKQPSDILHLLVSLRNQSVSSISAISWMSPFTLFILRVSNQPQVLRMMGNQHTSTHRNWNSFTFLIFFLFLVGSVEFKLLTDISGCFKISRSAGNRLARMLTNHQQR